VKKNLPLIVIVAGFLALFAIAAYPRSRPPVEAAFRVSASFYPLYFFASQIGGGLADVANVIPAGVEPHDYELAPQDIVRLEQSRLVVLNGGGLEPWAGDIRHIVDPAKTMVTDAGEGLMTRSGEEDGAPIRDPHVWLSPKLAASMADAILQGFVVADPANRMEYEANAVLLKEKLGDLDREYREGLAHCARRDFITSHAAFGYLAAEYGLNQVSIAGLSPEQEPSPATLASVVRFAREHDIRYIFFETMVSPRLAETIAREIGAKTLVLDPIEGLAGDEISAGKNYFTKMYANLANLKLALACTP